MVSGRRRRKMYDVQDNRKDKKGGKRVRSEKQGAEAKEGDDWLGMNTGCASFMLLGVYKRSKAQMKQVDTKLNLKQSRQSR